MNDRLTSDLCMALFCWCVRLCAGTSKYELPKLDSPGDWRGMQPVSAYWVEGLLGSIPITTALITATTSRRSLDPPAIYSFVFELADLTKGATVTNENMPIRPIVPDGWE